jgi:siroheme synthase (precorrin-2 oxidase/ferrochelatase)
MGSSPALSRFIREQIEMHYPALDQMVALQHELREHLKRIEPSRSRRNAILREVLHDKTLWEIVEKDPDKARTELKRRYLHA